MRPFTKKQRGFSLMEVVIYTALFVLISGATVDAIIMTTRAFSNLRISRDINDSAIKVMERLTRDVKNATSIDLAQSTFSATPGRLTLNTLSATGTPVIIEYYVATTTGQLRLKENGVDKGSLMSAKTQVDALVFYLISTAQTSGIKTELHLRSSRGAVQDQDHFYNTSMLRGTY